MDETPRPDAVKPKAKPLTPREQKLAAALRANLRRRKAPAAAKADSVGSDPES
jgi:hypothetical protein